MGVDHVCDLLQCKLGSAGQEDFMDELRGSPSDYGRPEDGSRIGSENKLHLPVGGFGGNRFTYASERESRNFMAHAEILGLFFREPKGGYLRVAIHGAGYGIGIDFGLIRSLCAKQLPRNMLDGDFA